MSAALAAPEALPAACRLEDVVITAELPRRIGRAPDHAGEVAALMELAVRLADAPDTILQALVESACRMCGAQSSGISIHETDAGQEVFRWHATTGRLGPYLHATLPRHFSPCGVVLDRGATQLMADPARFYPYIGDLRLPIREVLLAPFFRRGVPIGTLWVVHHDGPGRFDAEDARLVGHLAQFTSAATETLEHRRRAAGLDRQIAEVGSLMDVALKAAAIGTWNWDIANDRMYVDANVAALFSAPDAIANGGPAEFYLNALHPEDRERVRATLTRAVETGSVYETEFRIVQPDGAARWIRSYGQVHRDRAGKVARMPGVVLDITQQRTAEEALRRSEQMLGQQNRLLEQRVLERTASLDAKVRELETFSYTISHDLRAPLRAMQTYAHLLLDEYPGEASPGAREYARRIMTASDRMDRLIQDVLTISRITRHEMPLERIELGSFISQMLETYPHLAADRADITMKLPLHPVMGNPAALTQCLSNLLANAVKFVAPGVRPAVRLWTEAAGGRVRLYVEDNGIGIAPAHQQKIFGMFFQVKPRPDSTGVGLAVVQKAADRMGGGVSVASQPGAGSTFCLELAAPPGI